MAEITRINNGVSTYDVKDGAALHLSGGTMFGNITMGENSGNRTCIRSVDDLKYTIIEGSSVYKNGGRIVLCGKDYANNPGQFILEAWDGINMGRLTGSPQGVLKWEGSTVKGSPFAAVSMPSAWNENITSYGTIAYNGYIYVSAICSGAGCFLQVVIDSIPFVSFCDSSTSTVTLLVPIRKGSSYLISSNNIQSGSLSQIGIKATAEVM